MSRIIVASGGPGTTKSTFAQATANPVWYAELDPGSFDRSRKNKQADLHTYAPPLTALEDLLGVVDLSQTGRTGQGPALIAHKYKGWRELYFRFIQDYLRWLKEGPEHGVVDTGSILWEVSQNALRQRLQEEGTTAAEQTDRLKRLEYAEPNAQWNQMMLGAKGAGKCLVIVAHLSEIWQGGEPTGKFKPDGWRGLEGAADIVLEFSVVAKRPVATIKKAGGCHLDLVGWQLQEPTLDYVNLLIDCAKALQEAELPLPATPDEVVAMGRGLL